MVIVLKKGIPQEEKEKLKSFLEQSHFRVNEITGEEETIFGAVGRLGIDPREVEILPGVARVIPISKPYKMASREYKKENTVVHIPNGRGQTIKIGGQRIAAIAGPCAVESAGQMRAVAERVAAAGAVMLRGGAFKPRTSPYAFQGLGAEGIRILKEAGDEFGLPIATEIVSAEHIPVMKDYVDVYQIGARNMQNFELLKRVGELGKPVILKRGLSATIEEWLMAAEYLLSSGTDNVILCERGIRTYEKMTRNTLDLSAIPVLRSLTHLPIIVDPSHAVGIRDKVPPMALAAIAAGADGIIVEVHCAPDKAMSDGAQSLYPEQFEKLMRDMDVLAPLTGRELTRIRRPSRSFKTETKRDKQIKNRPVCAYSGGRGAYAEQAIIQYFDGEADEMPVNSFREIFQAVADGRADYGMIPIENSLAGSVYDNYDNLARFEDISIAAAVTLRIEHSLLAVPGATIESIRSVYSHPHGFPQCADFLSLHPEWNHIDAVSTATAAEMVASKGSIENAAIASETAARYNQLSILAQGIESNPRNYTRFAVITSARVAEDCIPEGGVLKASLMFTAKNESGALCGCLDIFRKQGLNMTKLESRPIQGKPWRYLFYADVLLGEDGNERERFNDAVQTLKNAAEDVRVLGVYPERTAG